MAINNLLNMQQLLDPVGQQLQAGLRQQRGQISQDVANRNAQIQRDKDARKQKWANALYLLGGALKGNDMSQDMNMLQQSQQLRTARENAAKLNAAIDGSNLNAAQKELAKIYPDAYAQHLFAGQKQPTSYQEYLLTDNTPTDPEYADFLKTNKGKGTNITVNTGDGTEGFSSGVSKTYSGAMKGSDAAFNTIGILDNMNNILDSGIDTGGGQEALLGLKQWIQTVDPDMVDKDKLANAESFQSASLLYLTPKVKQLGTNPTDADLKLFKDALPTLGKSNAGNRLIIDALKLSEQRKINEAEFVENWLYKNAELVKTDAFTANLDLNKALRAYRRSDEYKMPAEQLKERSKEILRQQALMDKGELDTITLPKNPWD
mgnify:CR=1 FL=1|tara:strand:+ start:190 stop:1317 length:1128 start_codon:yes stop_codon:yes gene_type:complete